MSKSMNLQANIRRNAQEMQDFFKGMNTWETKIKKKDKTLLRTKRTGRSAPSGQSLPPVRGTVGTVSMSTTARPDAEDGEGGGGSGEGGGDSGGGDAKETKEM